MEPNTFLLILAAILGTLAFVALGSVGLGILVVFIRQIVGALIILWVFYSIWEAVDNKFFRPRRIRKAREKFNRKWRML